MRAVRLQERRGFLQRPIVSAFSALVALSVASTGLCETASPKAAAVAPTVFSGTVTAPKDAAAPAAKLIVLWVVSSGSPDYVYLWGEGKVEGAKFTLALPAGAPPALAHNTFNKKPSSQAAALPAHGAAPAPALELAVGMVVAVPADLKVPAAGKLARKDAKDLFKHMVGGAPRFGVIRRVGTLDKVQWPTQFKAGELQCGQGQPAPEGQTFDSFVPVECGKMELIFGKDLDWVNWT